MKWLLLIAALLGCSPALAQSGNYDSGPIWVSATPANASHAAGTSLGGLFTVPLARQSGGSGINTNFGYNSSGASTGPAIVRIWSRKPTATTCTDNVAFARSSIDDAWLIVPPFSITPAANAVTTGDATTWASLTIVTWDYKNQDSQIPAAPNFNNVAPSVNMYVCVQTVGVDTADQNLPVSVMLSGPQD